MFEKVNQQYMEMQAAKQLLKQRYLNLKNAYSASNNLSKSKTLKRSMPLTNIEEEANITVNIKPGEEVQTIDKWYTHYNELEELKKVFFEFLKRWVEIDANATSAVNEPFLYKRL